MNYREMNPSQLASELEGLRKKYEDYKALGLKLDMSRGKPDSEQLDLSQGMLNIVSDPAECVSENGLDCRNYGLMDGIPESKRLFSELLDIPADNMIVCGNSSLNLMYDAVARAMIYGVYTKNGCKPWFGQNVKFICPVPGYDRHFGICESLGIGMINVDMTETGPDMDAVEALVADDASIKGIWVVPKYSNPCGITCSDETVRRLAGLKPAAPDFRIFWDNAYIIHDIYEKSDPLLNLFTEAARMGNPDMPLIFFSTSKITFPGAGVALVAASDNNINQFKSVMKYQTIGFDKLNQIRHVKFFKNAGRIREHMKLHAALLRPKFDAVLAAFERELKPVGVGEWFAPRGGYFISLNLPDGTARRTFDLCNGLGLKLTDAGATFPYGKDPLDRNLRIAPSYPALPELEKASAVLCLCAKIAAVEKALAC